MVVQDLDFISIVVPVKDEEDSLQPLFTSISDVLVKEDIAGWELIFIDDGSKDGSWSIMNKLVAVNPEVVRCIRLRRNFGKAVALAAGFRVATGNVVFTMDADLQDDPREIPQFLAKLSEGYDLVSGWKKDRKDPLSKTLPSKLFNRVTASLTGIRLHDFNCGFKAYRREVLSGVRLYGELHRYIPVMAHDSGFRIAEIEVVHHSRKAGVSKYGWERYPRGFLDLLTVLATTRYLQKPGHLFGGAGMISGAVGGCILGYLTVLWLLNAGPIGTRPLFFLGILLIILSVQLISLGVMAELFVRNSESRPLGALIAETRGETAVQDIKSRSRFTDQVA